MYADAKSVAPSPATSSIAPVPPAMTTALLTEAITIAPTAEPVTPELLSKAPALAVVAANGVGGFDLETTTAAMHTEVVIGIATLVIQGPAKAVDGQGNERVINNGSEIYLNDTIITGPRTYVKIQLTDGTVFQLGPLSRATLEHFEFQASNDAAQQANSGKFEATVQAGNFRFASGRIAENNEGTHTIIKTPSAVIGIRGSEIDGQIAADGSTIILHMEGLIDIRPVYSLDRLTVFEPGTRVVIPIEPWQPSSAYQATPDEIQRVRNTLAPLNPHLNAPSFDEEGAKGGSLRGELAPTLNGDSHEDKPPANLSEDGQKATHTEEKQPLPQGDHPNAHLSPEQMFEHLAASEHKYTPSGLPKAIPIAPNAPFWMPYSEQLEVGEAIKPPPLSPQHELPPLMSPVPPATHPSVPTPPAGNTSAPPTTDNTPPPANEIPPPTGNTSAPPTTDNTPPPTNEIPPPTGNTPEPTTDNTPPTNNVPPPIENIAPTNPQPSPPLLSPPTAQNDSFSVSSGQTSISLPIIRLLDNDSSVNGSIRFAGLGSATNGSVTLDNAGNILFTPNAAFAREGGSFIYQIQDANGAEASATVNLSALKSSNTPPTAVEDAFNTTDRQSFTISAASLLANDTDAENDVLTLVSVGNAVNASVSLDSNGDVVFSPDANFDIDHPARFVYVIADAQGLQANGNVTVTDTTSDNNHAPVANTDTIEVKDAANITISASTLLSNDTDLDGDVLSIETVGNALNGSVSLDGNGDVLFTPNADFVSNQGGSFVYSITDGNNSTNATVAVKLVNEAPLANDDFFFTVNGTPLTIAATSLLSNDSDPQGDPISLTQVGQAVNGQVSLATNGDVLFTPNAAFSQQGSGSFDYTLTDINGNTDTARVSVQNTNQAPSAQADQFTVDAGSSLNLNAIDLLANDSDPEGQTLTVRSVSQASNGKVEFDASVNTITVTPDPTISQGTLVFSYQAVDPQGFTDSAEVTVTIKPAPAQANPDDLTLAFNTPVQIAANSLLSNDVGQNLLITSVDSLGNAGLTLNLSRQQINFYYDFNQIQDNNTSFAYTVSDSAGETSTTKVTVTASNVKQATSSGGTLVGTDQVDLMQGDIGNDLLYGQAGNDILSGSAGDDVLDGGAGSDVLQGGDGNDSFYLDLSQGTDSIDGDTGLDRVNLQGSGQSMNLINNRTLPSNQQLQLSEIESIALNGNNNSLVLEAADVLSISGGTLVIEGDSSNSILSVGQGWQNLGDNGNGYIQYSLNTTHLLVSTDIVNQFVF